MSKNFWIDDNWSRDRLFWVGAVAAVIGVALVLWSTDTNAWAVLIGGLTFFAFTVASLGFIRTAVRAYREE